MKKKSTLLSSGIASLVIRICSIILGFLITICLVRFLGSADFGRYTVVVSTLTLLAIPMRLGLPILVTRETSYALQTQNTGQIKFVWRLAHVFVAIVGTIIAISIFLWFNFGHDNQVSAPLYFWATALVVLLAFGEVRSAALRGLGRTIISQMPETVLRPTLFLGFLACSVYLFEIDLNATFAMALHAFSALFGFLLGSFLLFRHTPISKGTVLPKYRYWLTSVLTLGTITGLNVLNGNFDIVMLGNFQSDIESGIYKICAMAAGLVGIGAQSLAAVLMPRISALYANNELDKLQRIATTGARFSLFVAAPLALLLGIFGNSILGRVFDTSYVVGYSALLILTASQLINASFGFVALLLNMCGKEKEVLKGVLASAAVNVILNALLIPSHGMLGAAAATFASVLLWNVILFMKVRKTLGVNCSIFAINQSKSQ